MIIQIKNTQGVYKPLDVFDDFDINYNHQYEDYNSIGGKKIPYTNNFKIPTTPNNRVLCGMPFDATYPASIKLDGRAMYTNGSVAFNFIATIESQVMNVLQPYIELSIIDLISKAINDLSKTKMSELVGDETFNLKNDYWMFSPLESIGTEERYWCFPFYNFNNKNATFSTDAVRGLSQLQPTFLVGELVKKMFNYFGISVESDFLTLDNQLADGIKAKELGLMLPTVLKTNDNHDINSFQSFYGSSNLEIIMPRVIGVPNLKPTTSRITLSDWMDSSVSDVPLKIIYDWKSDSPVNYSNNIYNRTMCSTVNGKLNINIKRNLAATDKLKFGFGILESSSIGLARLSPIVVSSTPPVFDVKIVKVETEDKWRANGTYFVDRWTESTSYNTKSAQKVGTATYTGIELDSSGSRMIWECDFYDDIDVEFDVVANEDIKLAYLLTPADDVISETISYSCYSSPQYYEMEMIMNHGYLEYKMITQGAEWSDSDFDLSIVTMTSVGGATSWILSFLESTDIPSGFYYKSNTVDYEPVIVPVPNVNISMSETMKSIKDYSLIEVLKIIMERYNLQLYTTSDGVIHVDTAENRKNYNDNFIIDHLVDEDMAAEYTLSDYGILTIKDSNPSFYDDDFNAIEDLVVSETKKETISVSFKSSIVNDKMFTDVYDGSGYELLSYVEPDKNGDYVIRHDMNWWGESDRTQVQAKDLKPTFVFLENEETPIFKPVTDNALSSYDSSLDDSDPPVIQIPFSWYNTFYNNRGVNNSNSISAKNTHSSGFGLISFDDNDLVSGDNNLYKKTWYKDISYKINDESVVMSIDVYVSEDSFYRLMNYPIVKWRGMEWELQGFNDYPLSAQDGGITSLMLIRKSELIEVPPVEDIPPTDVLNLVATSSTVADPVQLSWDASYSIDGISHYEIWRDLGSLGFSKLKEVVGLSSTDAINEPNTACYKILAVDNNGLKSVNFSNTSCVSVLIGDRPDDVVGVQAEKSLIALNGVLVTWESTGAENGINHHEVWRSIDGATSTLIGLAYTYSYIDYDPNSGSDYCYELKAVDNEGLKSLNFSDPSCILINWS